MSAPEPQDDVPDYDLYALVEKLLKDIRKELDISA